MGIFTATAGTPEPEPPVTSKDVAALISQIVSLQARLDALNAIVEVMAERHKWPLDLMRQKQHEIYAACLQKRLEQIEDVDPEAAAQIDQRGDTPAIDPDLLRDLRQGWKGDK